jgi:hypothetical protein
MSRDLDSGARACLVDGTDGFSLSAAREVVPAQEITRMFLKSSDRAECGRADIGGAGSDRAIHGEQFEILPMSAPEFSWTMSVS